MTTTATEQVQEIQEPLFITDATELMKKTMFLQINFGLLGVERTAKGTEQDIATEADKTLLRVKKRLFVSPEFKAIQKYDAIFRRKVDKLCVQSALNNVRSIPNGNFKKVHTLCLNHEVLRTGLVDKFVTAYPALYEVAKTLLGPLHRSNDYPLPENVHKKFYFTYEYVHYSTPEQLQMLDSEAFAADILKKSEYAKNAAEEITATRRAIFMALVSKLKTELAPGEDGKEKKFHKAAITKLQTFCDEFDVMNVTDDTKLAELKEQCQKLISGVTAENVRESEVFKAKLLKDIEGLGSALAPLTEEMGRKLKTVN